MFQSERFVKETCWYAGKEAPVVNIVPDVEVICECFLLGLIATPHMVSPSLVGDELPVRLHHHGVEVLDAVHHISGHGVAGSQRQHIGD